MLEHQRGRADGGQRVGRAGAGDVVGGAVHRLEQRRAGAGRVQVGRGGEADPAGDGAGEVGEDVAEEVVGDDDVVARGPLDQVDAGRVDVVVVTAHPGVLGGHLVDGPLPQVAGEGEDVGLVHEGEVMPGSRLRGELEGEADAALDPHAGVDRALGGHLVGRALAQEAALAGVGTFGVLPDDDEVAVRRGRAGQSR